MKIRTSNITPMFVPEPGREPLALAAACYEKWKSKVPFQDDLAHYLKVGFVISRPDLFMMMKIIDLNEGKGPAPEPAWFIRMAVGDLRYCLAALPYHLPWLCFYRRNKGVMHKFSFGRMGELAFQLKKET